MQAQMQKVQARREELVSELLGIRPLVRGALSEQFLKVPQKGQAEPALRGPYYVRSRSKEGQTRSRRVKKGEVERVREDVRNYKRFETLCAELAELTERLGELEREAAASEEVVKKGLKSRSNRAKK